MFIRLKLINRGQKFTFIRLKLVFAVFIALMLPYTIPSIIKSSAEAQVSKQDSTSADQQAIIQAYQFIAFGYKDKDVNKIFYFHAPNFTLFEDGELVNLEQCRQNTLRDFKRINQVVSSNYNFKEIEVSSSTATVFGTGHINTIAFGTRPLSIVFQFRDTWRRTTSGEWKAISSRILQRDIDLKPSNQLPPSLYYRDFGGYTSPVSPR